jgi:hypothetical protein
MCDNVSEIIELAKNGLNWLAKETPQLREILTNAQHHLTFSCMVQHTRLLGQFACIISQTMQFSPGKCHFRALVLSDSVKGPQNPLCSAVIAQFLAKPTHLNNVLMARDG